jgi:hypothetical protein
MWKNDDLFKFCSAVALIKKIHCWSFLTHVDSNNRCSLMFKDRRHLSA